MNIRVKIEFEGQAKGKYAFASTEHAASSYGQPVIVVNGEAMGHGDLAALSGTVVTADKALAEQLQKIGYRVRVSNPSAKWRKDNVKRVHLDLTASEVEILEDYCEANGVTMYAAIKHAIRALAGGK